MREKAERFVAYVKVKTYIEQGEVRYDDVFGAEFDHYPTDEELFIVWDKLEPKYWKLVSVRVEKQIRFN